jgi:nucleoside-diphosphate-sugar epimerase
MKLAVIAGSQGVIGRYITDHLLQLGDWEVAGLSRRTPNDGHARLSHIAVDLLDRGDAEAKLARLTRATHIFYCAFQARPAWADHNAPNLAMLVNAVEPIARVSKVLEHVNLIEGTKIYGSHLGPFRTPAKETDPPHMLPNFYYDQEQWLRNAQAGQPWSWSVLRPQTICGFALGNPMNLMMNLAVYAAISKELGLPLRFPGKPGAFNAVYQITDSALLAKGMTWAATSPSARNEVFNLTNGDYFRWCNVWPRIANAFGMEAGPVQTIKLAEFMTGKSSLWAAMQTKYGLEPYPYEQLAAWPFADYVWGSDWDIMSATTKIRRAGFHDVEDSEDMIVRMLAEFRRMRIVP